MKRQGSRQTKLEAYFGKRARITADTDEQPDEVVIVSTGMTALEMIAEAYADIDDDEQEEQEQVYANPADIAHDHDYFGVDARVVDIGQEEVASIENVEQEHDVVFAIPADVEHDHDYMGSSRIPTQTGGALGFESSDDEPEVEDDVSEASEAEESGEEEGVQEVVTVDAAPNIDDFYEVIDHAVKRIKKFGFSGYRTRFVLKDDERAGEPVEILRHVLQRFIDDAMENSREHGYSTDYMGLTFMNDGIKKANGGKGEWLVPFRAAVENNADKILQELEKFDQSENSPELFGTEITIAVTTIKRPEGGAWSRRVRKAQIRKKKKNPALVEIKNRDNLCMFRAIRVGMYYPFVSMEAEEDSDEDEETQSQEPSEAGEANAFETDTKRTPHEVNYIAAIVTCNECIDAGRWNDFEYTDCKVCGPEKVFKCGEWELPEERDIVDEFLDFMLHELPSGYASYAYAHNGGRYDNQLMMQKVYQREGLKPIIANSGHTMFQIRIKKTKHNNELFLRDSCLMFPMKLEDAPDAFNLPVTPKMHFPYRYNMRENYGKPIPGLPPAEDYILSKYKTDELKDFLKWHEEEDKKLREEGTMFVLEDKLEEYCYNDVEILIHALVRFRDIFNEQAGSDLFVKSCTITSGCLRLWKKKYLKKDRVAIVPNHGYGKFERQSAVALKYLKWFAWAHGIDVRHRDSADGEKRLLSHRGREYFLDGYIEPKAWDKPGFMRCNVDKCKYCLVKPDDQVAIEFNGCAYHGCPFKCFRSDTKLPTGKKSSEQYIITQNRAADIEYRGYTVISVHECLLKIELKQNKSMRKFFEYCFDTGHTDPRDGFCGGRVGPMRMYYRPQADEEIKFSDIVSLYPHVLRKEFPVGHPQVFRKFDDFTWDKDLWERKYSKEYKGVFKVLVLPPKDLTIPVLPLRDNNRA